MLLPVHSTIILGYDRNKNMLYLCFWFCLCKVERDCSKERVVFIKSYLLGLSPVGLEDKTWNTCKVHRGVVVTTKSGPQRPFMEPISVCIYFVLKLLSLFLGITTEIVKHTQTASGRPFNKTGAIRLATISETLYIMFIRLKPNK